jgi:thiopeptide-type bacteriocin biosynthesis protein
LLEALDEEVGIGFQSSQAPSAEVSPLLDGLAFPAPEKSALPPWQGVHQLLHRKLVECLNDGRMEIVIEPQDLAAFPGARLALPGAMGVLGVVAANSMEALRRGDFELFFRSAVGPAGVRLLGRFCHADPELLEHVREHLREEQSLDPDAIFAEVVHLPQGRTGNIMARPHLRDSEIEFLGRSGSRDPIHADDLTVGIEDGRIMLRHCDTGKRVIPRLSTAHNFQHRSLGLYRFLAMLQPQGTTGGASFEWGPLAGLPFLPRVRIGDTVVKRARWVIGGEEMETLRSVQGADLFTAIHRIRTERGLPRHVGLVSGEMFLPVDLDNILSVESLVDLIRKSRSFTLEENWPGPDGLVVEGPEGRFVNEIVVPVSGRQEKPVETTFKPVSYELQDRFEPGSEWLHVKLYAGDSTIERIMAEALTPLVHEFESSGWSDRWFFIRFLDPDHHLRLRFHGEPRVLLREVLPRLRDGLDPYLRSRYLWNMEVVPYEREMLRYGGDQGIDLCEEIFQIDSDAALAISSLTQDDEGLDLRWRLTLRGMDDTLSAMGWDLEDKHRIMESCALSFGREFGVRGVLKRQIRGRYRRERRALEEILSAPPTTELLALLAQRRERLTSVAGELARRSRSGLLDTSYDDLAQSFLHMHANRMLRSAQRAQEAVIYHFLERIYESKLARRKLAE